MPLEFLIDPSWITDPRRVRFIASLVRWVGRRFATRHAAENEAEDITQRMPLALGLDRRDFDGGRLHARDRRHTGQQGRDSC